MHYRYCSNCGAALDLAQHAPYAPQRCAACGKIHYWNSRPCAGALVAQNGRLLLTKRGIEPAKGCWDIPGGFCLPGELPEVAARRELLEETGLEIEIRSLQGIYMDEYADGGAPTMNFYYVAEVAGGTLCAADDAAEVAWFRADQLPEEIAFAHEQRVLADWKNGRRV